MNIPIFKVTRVNLVLMQNNFIFISKSCYENNYVVIDWNKIKSILATTDNYKFSHKHIKKTHTGNLLSVQRK